MDVITPAGLKPQGSLKALPAPHSSQQTGKVQFGELPSAPSAEMPFNLNGLQEKLQHVLQEIKTKVQAFIQRLMVQFNQWVSVLEQFGQEQKHLGTLGIQSQKVRWKGSKEAFYNEVVRPSYKEQARMVHPDRPKGNAEQFQAVNEAHQFLKRLYTENAESEPNAENA